MTRLLLLGAVLLLPLDACAGEPRTTMECRPGECPNIDARQTLGTLLSREEECLAILTAAMKAMEPYVFPQGGIQDHASYLSAVRQWNDAKQCWKNQP